MNYSASSLGVPVLHRPLEPGQHVGVVVGAGDLGGQDVVAEPGPHAADLVAGDLLAAAGAADHDAPVHLTVHDLPADVLAQPRVVDDRLGIVRATIVHPVAAGRQPFDEVRLQGNAVVVTSDRDAHVRPRL